MSDVIQWSAVIALWVVFALLVIDYQRRKKAQEALREMQQSLREQQAEIQMLMIYMEGKTNERQDKRCN